MAVMKWLNCIFLFNTPYQSSKMMVTLKNSDIRRNNEKLLVYDIYLWKKYAKMCL